MNRLKWKKISAFSTPSKSPGFLLWKVSTLWRRQIEGALSRLALTHPQFVLLANLGWLTRENTELNQAELARHAGTDVNMTSQVLRTLEKKGLIERFQKKGDERAKLLCLTKEGANLVSKAIPIVEEVDKKFFSKISEKKMIDLLQQLEDSL